MIRKNSKFLLLLIVMLILSACNSGTGDTGTEDTGGGEGDGEVITLKLASIQPETHTMTINFFRPFMERATELSDGQLEFEFYPAEQLGKASDYLDLTRDGVMDIGYYLSTYYTSNMPITANLFGIPGMYEGAHPGGLALHNIASQEPILTSDFLNNGVRPVSSFLVPTYQFWTTGTEIKVPADLEGKQVRAPGGIANVALETLGASPVSITATETYEAVDRNVVDILNWYGKGVEDYGLSELIKYGVENVDFGGLSGGLMINEDVWQSLPESAQQAIEQAGAEIAESFGEIYEQEEQDVVEKYKESGDMEIYTLSEDELAQWEEFYTSFREEAIADLDNSEDVTEAMEMFQAEVESLQ